jgi:hypothetical protein
LKGTHLTLYILHDLLYIRSISAVGIELSAKVVVRRNWFCGESGFAAKVVLRRKWFCGESGFAAKVALRPKWPLPKMAIANFAWRSKVFPGYH